jgi:peptidoglycan/LPS O-acetylase OafA/YrhL
MPDLLFSLGLAASVAVAIATLTASGLGRLGFPLPEADRRIGCVDGLRGYLALSVLVHHFFVWMQSTRPGGSWRPPDINILNELGAGSVALFFMTTGLVFYPRILVGLRATLWPAVYMTRIFRIVPLTAFSVGIVTALIILRTGDVPDRSYIGPAARWLCAWSEPNLLGYPDSGRINAYVLWSLKVEWIFYLFLLPICAAAMDGARQVKCPTWTIPVLLLVVSLVGRVGMSRLHVYLDILHYIPSFAIGMLAFECQSRRPFAQLLTRPAASIGACMALVFAMSAAQFPYGLALPFFALFFISVACGASLGGLLTTRGARVLGECSFGLYLLHGVLLDILFTDAKPLVDSLKTTATPALLPVVMVAAVLTAACAYLVIERPMIRSGRWLARWIVGRRLRLTNPEADVAP